MARFGPCPNGTIHASLVPLVAGWCGADVWSAVAKPRRVRRSSESEDGRGADTALDWWWRVGLPGRCGASGRSIQRGIG